MAVNTADSISKERSNAELNNLAVVILSSVERDGVADNDLLKVRLSNTLVCRAREDTMSGEGIDTVSTTLLEFTGSMNKSTGSVNHIINNDDISAFNRTDEIHTLDSTSLDTLLNDHGKTSINTALLETITETLGTVDTTSIGRDDLGSLRLQAKVAEVVKTNDLTFEVIAGSTRTEETLDLTTVKIDGNDTINTHGFHEASNISSGDRHTRSHLTILTSITVVRNDSSDLASGGTTHGRDHEKKLDEVIIHTRRAGRLDDVDLLTTDVVHDLDTDLTISVALDGSTTKFNLEELCHLLSKRNVGATREDLELIKRVGGRSRLRVRKDNGRRGSSSRSNGANSTKCLRTGVNLQARRGGLCR